LLAIFAGGAGADADRRGVGKAGDWIEAARRAAARRAGSATAAARKAPCRGPQRRQRIGEKWRQRTAAWVECVAWKIDTQAWQFAGAVDLSPGFDKQIFARRRRGRGCG